MNLKKRWITAVFSAALIAASLGLAGCGPKGASDQALATDIQAKLYADQTARTANVKVAVANGVVTLTGDAPSSDVALQVVNIANGTSGVKSVDNELKIAPVAASTDTTTPPPPAPAASPTPMASNAPPPHMEEKHADRDHDRDRDHPHHDEAPPQPVVETVPAGTDIGVQMIDGISSKTNTAGQTFRASISTPVVVDGNTVFPGRF